MASPVFDTEQYELRGKRPVGLTLAQKAAIDSAIERVNGQLDWNAQLLGFSGTNYWGKRIPTADGSYKWKGLPETVSEKRSVQTGAFGVYSKDKPYSERPAPFNRSVVGASADQTFDIYESEGATLVVPYGQPLELLYEKDPRLVIGGEYVFNALVTAEAGSGSDEAFYVVQDLEQGLTSVRVMSAAAETLLVRKQDSTSAPFIFFIRSWVDCSDWEGLDILDQFLGVWGNKGNAIASDFLFDSLGVHGFDEHNGLTLDNVSTRISIPELLSYVGLVPGPASALLPSNFNFEIENCASFFTPSTEPGSPEQFGSCVNPNFTFELSQFYSDTPSGLAVDPGPENSVPIGCNGVEYLFPPTCSVDNGGYEAPLGQFYLNGGDYDFVVVYSDAVNDGIYDRDPFFTCDGLQEDYERVIDYDDLITDVDGNPGPILMTDPGQFNETELVASGDGYDGFVLGFDGPELAKIGFDYAASTPYGAVALPCVEWVFDPSLDNSTYWPVAPEAAWMGTDDGEYDRLAEECFLATQSAAPCSSAGALLSFDDGIFDSVVYPHCEQELAYANPCSEEVDGEYYDLPFNPLPPPQSNADCRTECGLVDGSTYSLGPNPLPFQDLEIDGGAFEVSEPQFVPQVVPCAVDPVRVRLDHVLFAAPSWRMRPSVSNSMSPLRLWKNRVLNVADLDLSTAFVNPLIADQNTGCEDAGSYRHFARLPVEYNRNGKFWNRAEAVLANQSYFSRLQPPSHAELPVINEKPLLYDEVYAVPVEQLPDDATFYYESYLVSDVKDADSRPQSGFVESSVSYEEPAFSKPFVGCTIVEYDPYSVRLLGRGGERTGSYLKWSRKSSLSGFLETDLEEYKLRYTDDSESHVSDASEILVPNASFPDDPDQAPIANYSVCYAYFVADLSASDDPVFDPTSFYCWRKTSVANVQPLQELLATNQEDLILTSSYDFINLADDGTTTTSLLPTHSRYVTHG